MKTVVDCCLYPLILLLYIFSLKDNYSEPSITCVPKFMAVVFVVHYKNNSTLYNTDVAKRAGSLSLRYCPTRRHVLVTTDKLLPHN